MSADTKKSKIGWNLTKLQAKTWRSTKIMFGRNGQFQELQKSWTSLKTYTIQSNTIDLGVIRELMLWIFISTKKFSKKMLFTWQKNLKTTKNIFYKKKNKKS